MVTKGIWIDDPVKDVLKPAFWDKMVAHDLKVGAIMVERLGGDFDEIYQPATLEKIKVLALARDIELVLTVWSEPDKAWLTEFAEKIPDMLEAAGAAALEFDLEGNWLRNAVKGYPNLDKAGDAFVQVFEQISEKLDVRTEVTTYPFHDENNRAADVAPHASRLLPQAYSVRTRKRDGQDWQVPWDHDYGPGKMQRLTLERAKKVPGVGSAGGPLISCGLAAYDQEWPGASGERAMQSAWDAMLPYNPIEARFWSSKWVFGIMANGYASRFITSLKGK